MAGVDFNFQRRIAAMDELSCVHEELARQGYHNITILGFSLYARDKPNPNAPQQGRKPPLNRGCLWVAALLTAAL